ncbi:MAG TPA: methyl-accepting chemotaxis protein [Lachnospiraceae bacterium]|nr:methyl-accepting chemotaxis protein [Lachnospiraceae bacterium]
MKKLLSRGKDKRKKRIGNRSIRKKRSKSKSRVIVPSEVSIKGIKKHKRISAKLIVSFMIPVCFVILIGIISYSKSSDALLKRSKESSIQSIDMTSEYMLFGLDAVKESSSEYLVDKDIGKYVQGNYTGDTSEYNNLKKSINMMLATKVSTNKFLQSIWILPAKSEISLSSTSNASKNLYSEFIKTDVGSKLAENAKQDYWIGSNETFDQALGSETSQYAVRYVRSFPTGNAVMLFDIKLSKIQEIIDGLDLGTGSVIAFVSQDGREVYNSKAGKLASTKFYEQEFYKESVESSKSSGSRDITFNGNSYLYLYSKIGDTNTMICGLIPKSTIMKAADSIGVLTILIVAIAAVISIVIGVRISFGIQRIIRYIIKELKKVAMGDLTVDLQINREDEFRVLSSSIDEMLENMRKLIGDIQSQSTSVETTSTRIEEASELFTDAIKQINGAMNDIRLGVNQQAEDSQKCLEQMDELSGKIENVNSKTGEISVIANSTKQSIDKGVNSMQLLNVKTRSTTEITSRIINHIEELEEKSRSINSIVGAINEIASQTNLLSLNASIEAARAGAAGNGFQVVAEEIRNLADQSMKSVREIEKLIKDIQDRTRNAVNTANEADGIMKEQELAVKQSEKAFEDINNHVENLICNVEVISDTIHVIEQSRADTLTAIEDISAVSQQTAAASIAINETTNHQLVAVENLNSLSGELRDNAKELADTVGRFTI